MAGADRLGALGDEAAVEEFGDIARQEYRAVGIHVALHPLADLATEPRWARIMHTFGEDAELAARLVGASDETVDDVLHGRVAPEGKLPFELPASMEAVRAETSDVPESPLFRFGHGLSY